MEGRSRGRDPVRIGTVLDALLGPKGLGGRRSTLEHLRKAWIAAAGPDVAGHSRIRSLRRGVLTIEVDSGALCHQLAAFRKEELLVAVREDARRADVQDLRFRVGSLG
jgi:predicted nucleic acid-binding Zn ribbon protein